MPSIVCEDLNAESQRKRLASSDDLDVLFQGAVLTWLGSLILCQELLSTRDKMAVILLF